MDTTQSRAATVTRSRWRFFIDSVRLNTSKKTKTTSALLIGSFSLFQISTSRPARAFAATLLFKAPLLLNHPPLSLPCLLLLILGATLQYFYLPTPPPPLLVHGPYVYENDTPQECLLHAKMSLSFLIGPIYVHIACVCVKVDQWVGRAVVRTDRLAALVITLGRVRAECACVRLDQIVTMCFRVKALQLFLLRAVTGMLCGSALPAIFTSPRPPPSLHFPQEKN